MSDRERRRDICWTLNNWSEDDLFLVRSNETESLVRYICWQQEVGEHGTPHLQGYLELTRAADFSRVHQLPGLELAHFSHRSGTKDEARNYCCKEDGTEIPDSFEEYGTRTAQGTRSDIASVVEAVQSGDDYNTIATAFPAQAIRYYRGIRDLLHVRDSLAATAEPRLEVDVSVFWGVPGAGKSYDARQDWDKTQVFSLTRANANGQGIVWFDGYSGQRLLLIEDFYGWIQFQQFLGLLDPYALSVQTKGGFVSARWTHVVITANSEITRWYHYNPDNGLPLDAVTRRVNRLVHYPTRHPLAPSTWPREFTIIH